MKRKKLYIAILLSHDREFLKDTGIEREILLE